jgi:hypothetical protein
MRFHADETDFKTASPLHEDAQQIVIGSRRRQEALISPCSVNDLTTPHSPEKTSPRISRMTRINAIFSNFPCSSRRLPAIGSAEAGEEAVISIGPAFEAPSARHLCRSAAKEKSPAP